MYIICNVYEKLKLIWENGFLEEEIEKYVNYCCIRNFQMICTEYLMSSRYHSIDEFDSVLLMSLIRTFSHQIDKTNG